MGAVTIVFGLAVMVSFRNRGALIEVFLIAGGVITILGTLVSKTPEDKHEETKQQRQFNYREILVKSMRVLKNQFRLQNKLLRIQFHNISNQECL